MKRRRTRIGTCTTNITSTRTTFHGTLVSRTRIHTFMSGLPTAIRTIPTCTIGMTIEHARVQPSPAICGQRNLELANLIVALLHFESPGE
jgi:hypothetical protein